MMTVRPNRAPSVAFLCLSRTRGRRTRKTFQPPRLQSPTPSVFESALTDFRPDTGRRWALRGHRAHAPWQRKRLEDHPVAHFRRAARPVGEADWNLADAAAEPQRAVQHLDLKGVAVAADGFERDAAECRGLPAAEPRGTVADRQAHRQPDVGIAHAA